MGFITDLEKFQVELEDIKNSEAIFSNKIKARDIIIGILHHNSIIVVIKNKNPKTHLHQWNRIKPQK